MARRLSLFCGWTSATFGGSPGGMCWFATGRHRRRSTSGASVHAVGLPAPSKRPGCLDGDPGMRPDRHIFTGPQHNPSWFSITDGLEQVDDFHLRSPSLPIVESHTPTDVPAEEIAGSCVCGTVVFHITEAFLKVHHCHCQRCQKGRAAAHATNGIGRARAVKFIEGEHNLSEYKVPHAEFFKQVFCSTCGSLMPEVYAEQDGCCVSLGALDTDPRRPPDDNIFVAYHAPWYEITDGLTCFDEAPPGGYA